MNFKKIAEKWANKILKEENLDFNNKQSIELMILGSLTFDKDGNWIPMLKKK